MPYSEFTESYGKEIRIERYVGSEGDEDLFSALDFMFKTDGSQLESMMMEGTRR